MRPRRCSGAGRTRRLRPVPATVPAAGRARCALPTNVVRSDSTNYVRLTLITRSASNLSRPVSRARARAAAKGAAGQKRKCPV